MIIQEKFGSIFPKKSPKFFLVLKSSKFKLKSSSVIKKNLRSDRRGEYLSFLFEDFCQNNGIRHEFTARYTPQQNVVAARKNMTIMDMVCCTLKKKNKPAKFWAEVVSCAVYLINRSFTKSS